MKKAIMICAFSSLKLKVSSEFEFQKPSIFFCYFKLVFRKIPYQTWWDMEGGYSGNVESKH